MKIDGYMPVRIFSGSGALDRAGDAICALGNKCMIVTGGRSAANSGALGDVKKLLTTGQIPYIVFDRVEPNPLTATCHEAGLLAAEFGADFLIGIGGGSPLDAVKAVAVYAANPSFSHEDIYTRRDRGDKPLPSVLIGTTAGTGSELTGVSVLTNAANGRKKSISGADCYGRIAVCDHRYTMSMPYDVTVSTALDAFAHATESCFSAAANDLSVLYALKAAELVWNGLKVLLATGRVPDEPLREKLYVGSLYAGLAINLTGTLFPHTVGYVLTERRGIAHGRACAAFAPVLFDRCARYAPEKLQVLIRTIGAEKDEILHTLAALAAVSESFSDREIEEIAVRWQEGTVNNFIRTPGGFTRDDAVEALRSL